LYQSVCAPYLNKLHQSLTNDPCRCQHVRPGSSIPKISQFENWFTCIREQNLNTLPRISGFSYDKLLSEIYNSHGQHPEVQALSRYFIRDCQINNGNAIIDKTKFTCQKYYRYDNSWGDYWSIENTCPKQPPVHRW
jgi:hypothetical protein